MGVGGEHEREYFWARVFLLLRFLVSLSTFMFVWVQERKRERESLYVSKSVCGIEK